MIRTRYKLTSAQLGGFIMLTYLGDALNLISLEVKQPLNAKQWFYLSSAITPSLSSFTDAGFTAAGLSLTIMPEEDEPVQKGNSKVAMFCQAFEKNSGIKYKVTKADGAKLRDLPVSGTEFETCIDTYFKSGEWYLQPKSIANFCGKINEIRLLISTPVKSKFPIPYDYEYAKTLNTEKVMEYSRVLREAGYTYKEMPGRGGRWVKEN